MRIIGGTAAGKIVKAPKGLNVRPTPDLVRQAIFNSLADRVEDARVLELFGGTGALSLESLSRGARSAMVIELSVKHGRFIEQNHRACGLPPGSMQMRILDVFAALPKLAAQEQRFDLVFADPPFGDKNVNKRSESFSQKALDDETLPGLIAPGGTFILGHCKRDTLEIPPHWHERKLMKHGDSQMRFLEPKL
ncbi:MAG: RsmD family RNA methyltransferase [Verrucomicrobiia bacterium]|jgi:16S rRNA (guanine966-N2)-methyltransferase